MLNRRPRTPTYRLHKSTGQAVVTLCGQDHYLGKFGTNESREAYERLLAEWFANRRSHVGSSIAGVTVNEILAAYLRFANDYYCKDGRLTSEIHGIALALRPLKRLYGRTPAGEFGPQKMKAVRQALIEQGLCRRVVNQGAGRVRRVFKWAVEHELIPPSIYHGLLAVPGLKRGRSGRRPSRGAASKALLFNSKLGGFPGSSVLTHTRQFGLSPDRKTNPAG